MTLVNSTIDEWHVVVNGGHATIQGSPSIAYLLTQNGSEVVVDNVNLRRLDVQGDAQVLISRIDHMTFDSDAADPVRIVLYEVEIGTLQAEGLGDGVRLEIDVFCDECRIDQAIKLSSADMRMKGDIEILASPRSVTWESSTVTRSYRVVLSDSSGEPITGAPIGLIDAAGSGETVVDTFTDDDGEAVFALDFDDDDWNKQYRLGAFVGGQVAVETLTFFSPSPIFLSMALSTPALVSDPAHEPANECYSIRSDNDSIEFLSIQPAPGTVLQAGTLVVVEALIRYSLDSHDTGRVMLWHLLPPTGDDKYSGGRAGFAEVEVSRGSGVIVVTGSFEVPDIGEIDIRVSLDPLGGAIQSGGFDCWSSMASDSTGEYPVSTASDPGLPITIVSVEPADTRPLVEVSGILVRPYVDGRSLLMISGSSVQWLHLDAAAPGRYEGVIFDTYVDGAAWAPQWPDRPDAENRDCRCFPSSYEAPQPLLPMDDIALGLEVLQSRAGVRILEQPSARNSFTAVVEFDDNGPGGADWYEVRVVPTSEAAASTSPGMTKGATISGRVTDADSGIGISNVRVEVDNVRDGGPYFEGYTDGAGRDTMDGVVPGTYRIRVRSSGRGYIREYYNDRLSWDDADHVTVVGPELIDGIDFALELGGTISGRLFDVATNLPISDIHVEAQPDGWDGQETYGRSDADGRYTLRGLAPGAYRILARAQEKGYVEVYYDQKLRVDDYDLITVSGSESIEGIDFPMKLGATISGRVLDGSTGFPIADMDVSAGPIGGRHLSWSNTDSEGRYVLTAIPDGLIEVEVGGQGYIEMRRIATVRDCLDVTYFDF